ncbi:hypothetical protein MALGJ_37680 [Mycolicibacter algericus]|uniref:Uncharacterized protein n=1 Tax=Mycolicibacter algericus TaxID=1288388 RepID=A0A7I9YEY1_MYCAL|nr:hypothetical protein MALGJ_37680 [Mycolicibacter algericus]
MALVVPVVMPARAVPVGSVRAVRLTVVMTAPPVSVATAATVEPATSVRPVRWVSTAVPVVTVAPVVMAVRAA